MEAASKLAEARTSCRSPLLQVERRREAVAYVLGCYPSGLRLVALDGAPSVKPVEVGACGTRARLKMTE